MINFFFFFILRRNLKFSSIVSVIIIKYRSWCRCITSEWNYCKFWITFRQLDTGVRRYLTITWYYRKSMWCDVVEPTCVWTLHKYFLNLIFYQTFFFEWLKSRSTVTSTEYSREGIKEFFFSSFRGRPYFVQEVAEEDGWKSRGRNCWTNI